MVTGLILFSFGIIFTIRANIGYPPWDVFHVGLAETLGLSLGIVSIIAGIVILIIVRLLGEKLGLGTICNIFLIGIFLDIILEVNIIPEMNTVISGIALLIIGLFAISLGSYFYIKSAFGAGPRDNLMVVLTKKTKIPVGICRSIIELAVTIAGWLLGGMVGIGTIIAVIGIGFCIQIVFKIFKFDVTAVQHENLIETFSALIKSIKKN